MCLRMPENAKQVMEAGGAQLLIQILKTHQTSSSKVAVSENIKKSFRERVGNLNFLPGILQLNLFYQIKLLLQSVN